MCSSKITHSHVIWSYCPPYRDLWNKVYMDTAHAQKLVRTFFRKRSYHSNGGLEAVSDWSWRAVLSFLLSLASRGHFPTATPAARFQVLGTKVKCACARLPRVIRSPHVSFMERDGARGRCSQLPGFAAVKRLQPWRRRQIDTRRMPEVRDPIENGENADELSINCASPSSVRCKLHSCSVGRRRVPVHKRPSSGHLPAPPALSGQARDGRVSTDPSAHRTRLASLSQRARNERPFLRAFLQRRRSYNVSTTEESAERAGAVVLR